MPLSVFVVIAMQTVSRSCTTNNMYVHSLAYDLLSTYRAIFNYVICFGIFVFVNIHFRIISKAICEINNYRMC